MKRILIFAVAAILLSRVVSVSASNSNANGKNPKSPVVPVEQESIDCIDDVKNHGAYVSCIARQQLGGTVTSEAAQSDIGKKIDGDITPTTIPTITVAPTVTPVETITPTMEPTVTEAPTVTPTETITPTTIPTAAQTEVLGQEQQSVPTEIKGLIDQIKNLLKSLLTFPQLN